MVVGQSLQVGVTAVTDSQIGFSGALFLAHGTGLFF
jgi:hypothetical protein